MMPMIGRARARFFFLIFLSSAVFFAQTSFSSSKDPVYEKLEILARVLSYVEVNYPEEIDSEKLIDDAIAGLLSDLDPHTSYMPPEMFREMQVDTKGEFGGLGIEVGMKDDILTIIAPIEDTPASRAGVKAGDKILQIDDQKTFGMTLFEAVKLLRGPRGSQVMMLLQREGEKEPVEVNLTRERIFIRSISSEILDGEYGYLRIKSFQEKTTRELRRHIRQLEKKSKADLKGYILDLRNNPGGLLDQAIGVADKFLEEGVIVSTKGKQGKFQEVKIAHKEGTIAFLPLIVLINEGSASASEIVAGAMQDHHRAILLGTSTFGKGSVQTIIDLGDGSGLKLTIGQYYTPSGRSIQAKGIDPDITVLPNSPSPDAQINYLREKDLEGHLENPQDRVNARAKKKKKNLTQAEKLVENDVQLKRALEYLKTLDVFRHRFVPKV